MPSEFDPRRTAEKAPIVDIATARTLPAYYYTAPEVLEIERRELFFRTWQFMGHATELAETGSYITGKIFDQEVVLVRGSDGTIRGFYNVCVHRGHPLAEGKGRVNRLVCPYHAWTYALDGSLVGIRRGASTTKVPRSEICLTEVRVDRILDFVFVNLDPEAVPLAEYAPGLAEDIEARVPGIDRFRPTPEGEPRNVAMDCNWKVIVDNYLECYHCETAHPTFCDLFHAKDVKHEFGPHYSRQHLPSAHKAVNAAYPIDLETDLLDANYWFLFPNTLIGQGPGRPGITVSRVIPTGAETAIRRRYNYEAPGYDTKNDAARTHFYVTKVGAEDQALCEAVQRGMRQQAFNQGLYIIDPEDENFTEEAVRAFHTSYSAKLEARLAAETR